MGKFEKDLTGGSVAKQLISFSLPFLLSNFIQALYNVADMLIVSRLSGASGPSAVSGVSNGGQITMLVTFFVMGFTVGGTVLIGQYFGAKQMEDMKKTIGTMFTVLLFMSFFITVVMISVSEPLLRLINVPNESFQQAKDYLNICMLGTFFIFGYNAISAILYGMGDSRRPFFFVTIACVTNIFLDILFVGPLGMEAAGAAIATVISQGLSLILSVVYLIRNKFIFDFKPESFRVDLDKLKLLLKIGMPTSIQNIVVGFSFLIMTVLVNGYGVYASAAMGIVAKFNGFAILPAVAMSASVSSMSAQNIGAGFPERALETMFTGMKIVFPICFIFFLLACVSPQQLLRIFTDDPMVVEQGIKYIRPFCFDYLVVPFTFCANGLLTGAGHTTFTMFNGMLSSIFLRVPIAYMFGQVLHMGLTGIGLAAPVASVGALIVCVLYLKSGRWTDDNIAKAKTD